MRSTHVLALLLASLLVACSDDTEAKGAPDGARLFREQACVTCHGDRGQGTMLGPALTNAHAVWTREMLVEYLNDPQAFAQRDERLAKQGKAFFQPMPAYKALKSEERAAVSDFVLGLR
jgi:mono/diheme cytochrome c family protein